MIWLRLVDPECEDIPRRGYNYTDDQETTELDTNHILGCVQCMDFFKMTQDKLDAIDEPLFPVPEMVCRHCDNPLGEPWHHPKSRRCYFGEGPLWQRAWDRVRRFFWFHI